MAGKGYRKNRKAHFTLIWKLMSAPRDRGWFSPEFTIHSMERTRWSANLTCDSDGKPTWGSISRRKDDGPHSIQIEFELLYSDDNGSSLVKSTAFFHEYEGSRELMFPKIDRTFDKAKSKCCPKGAIVYRCRIWRKGTNVLEPEFCFASTQYDVYQRHYVWAVKKFSSLQQGDKRTRVVNGVRECPRMVLTLSLDKKDGKECVFLYLDAPQLTNSHFLIEAETTLLDDEGMVSLSKKGRAYVYSGKTSDAVCIFEKSELLCHPVFDDVLLLQCDMKLTPGISRREIEDYILMDYSIDWEKIQEEEDKLNKTAICPGRKFQKKENNELNKTAICPFKEIINKFKEDETLSDVCLRTDHISFPVHKLVLSSRSPVFKARFTSDMRENTSKCIDIPDLDAETLNRLLQYIYQDDVPELTWETAANLLKAADKYELLDLKEKCSSFLKSNLSESNVCEILILADTYHDESLFNSVQEYIVNNSKIISSNVWKVFKQNHSNLALEIAEKIICSMTHSLSVN